MLYSFSWPAFLVFAFFVATVLALSFFLGAKAKSAKGYYAAHGQIPWFINGVAFAGDYLSAASFLGICGMIAFYGYDGFLYSIGYLAGWIVALFVIAEPIKRMGKFTFADAMDARFNSRGIKLTVAISTLVVSVFYLIPQMVGAGALVKPLLGLEHWVGVLIVGVTVILIVVTAGMVSTTWVQFIKGSLLVLFCTVLVVLILQRGFVVTKHFTSYQTLNTHDGHVMVNGKPQSPENDLQPAGHVIQLPGDALRSGPQGPIEYLRTFSKSTVTVIVKQTGQLPDGSKADGYAESPRQGADLLTPGASPTFAGVRSNSIWKKLDFLSLMLALFCGTASLPHILIRYYTVKDAAAARKSTVVGIAAIGFFYILTLYLGIGAMTSGALDPTDSNMAAPLLAKSFSNLLFAIISAIAFTTVLGTVSGLIMAGAGAVAHDLLENVLKVPMNDHQKVLYGKIASVCLGAGAMVLGILFKKMNVSFLVGWAFNIAASANLPSLVMLLFWKRTTSKGIAAAVTVGMLTSLGWILLSPQAYKDVYTLDPASSIIPFSQPALVTIPLGFLVLVAVSLLTRAAVERRGFEVITSSER
jgi:cation/acetate symporter